MHPTEFKYAKECAPYFREKLAPHLRSRLHPSGQHLLEATLGPRLGYGRSAAVHALENVTVSGITSDTVVPQLVIKIARFDHAAWMAREAWFYDELVRFQGSIVPYCFGWFEMELPAQFTVPALQRSSIRHSDTSSSEQKKPSDLEIWEAGVVHPLLAERDSRRDLVSVLILERLGGMLPLCKPVDKNPGDG